MSHASTIAWILLTTAALAFSGCSGADVADAPAHGHDTGHHEPTKAVPVNGGSAVTAQIRIPAGSSQGESDVWFDVDGPIEAPGTVQIINEDDAAHRVVGEFRQTAYGAAASHPEGQAGGHDGGPEGGHEDGHEGGHGSGHEGGHAGGHDHGGEDEHTHEDPAFDVSLEPGDSVEFQLEEVADIAVHCHPHPFMVDTWDVRAAENSTFDVAVNTLNLTASPSGELRMGHDGDDTATLNVSMASPDLVSFTATLRWDDADDDGPLGGDVNQPDVFSLRLIDPTGVVAAEETLEAREGTLTVGFTPETDPWPETIEGHGASDAMQNLIAQRPPDTTWSGQWNVEVRLVQAPGFLPADVEDGGAGHDAPAGYGFDGHQAWDLELSAVHAWPSLDGPVQEVTAGLPIEDGHAGHEH